jgi:FtsZ-binding cell division protein ZapB
MAAAAWQEADTLKKELGQLKAEEKENAEAHVQVKEKEDNFRNSIKALLGNFIAISSNFFLI